MKKYLVRGILTVVLTVGILCGIIIGVPKIIDYIDGNLSKQEYRVEDLPVYAPEDMDKNYIAKDSHSSVISGNGISGNGISGNGTSNIEEYKEYWSTVTPNNFVEVDNSYFKDALFIGDSRTVGLREFSTVSQADYYAATGLTVYKALESEFVTLDGIEDKLTIKEALSQKKYGQVYIMLGINEIGTGTVDAFVDKYREIVDCIRELQPEAVIFIQGIMQVTTKYSEASDYIHIEDIAERNEHLSLMADGQQIIYLDINPLLCDENGGLHEVYTSDGVHLKAEYIFVWVDFLKKYGIIL